jgi:hypothetical protein
MTSRRFWSPWLSCSAVRSRRRRSRQSRHAGAWRCRLLPTFPGGCKAGGTSAGRMVCSKSVFKEFHGRRRPLPARRGVRKRRKQTEVKPGKRIQGIPQAFKAYRGAPTCSPMAPRMVRTRGGSEARPFRRCSRHAYSFSKESVRRIVSSRGKFAYPAAVAPAKNQEYPCGSIRPFLR